MGFDAKREDYLRLSLRFEQTLDGMAPGEAMRAYAGFGRRFARDRDSLPQTDADRAFHLVAKAATLIDYELPFADDVRARTIIDRGHDLLSEALSLDPACIDARRMMAASEQVGFDSFYDYLAADEAEVAEQCRAAGETDAQAAGEGRAEAARALAQRPYLRWLGTMAAQALICGRNREALEVCARALEADPYDEAGVRYSAALAYAKLEDENGLDALTGRGGFAVGGFERCAWVLLSRANLAYKRCDFATASAQVRELVGHYPHACAALIRQHEMAEGVFSRIAVAPFSEDELTVALSEATLLLQEGREVGGRGPFGAWVAGEAEWLALPRERAEVEEAKRFAAEKAARFAQGGYGEYGYGPGGMGLGPEGPSGEGGPDGPSAGGGSGGPGTQDGSGGQGTEGGERS